MAKLLRQLVSPVITRHGRYGVHDRGKTQCPGIHWTHPCLLWQGKGQTYLSSVHSKTLMKHRIKRLFITFSLFFLTGGAATAQQRRIPDDYFLRRPDLPWCQERLWPGCANPVRADQAHAPWQCGLVDGHEPGCFDALGRPIIQQQFLSHHGCATANEVMNDPRWHWNVSEHEDAAAFAGFCRLMLESLEVHSQILGGELFRDRYGSSTWPAVNRQ